MKPYYQDQLVTIYHADARELIQTLEAVDTIITDPVWPNPIPELRGSEDPLQLFWDVARFFPRVCRRCVIQLGCDSDPRFLLAIPGSMTFLRSCHLKWIPPMYKGRVLRDADVAYVFGRAPLTSTCMVMPGATVHVTHGEKNPTNHPCPRSLQHVSWLCKWFADGTVLDPFAGSGTTLLAAKLRGIQAIGIESEEQHCEEAATRCAQDQLFGDFQFSGAADLGKRGFADDRQENIFRSIGVEPAAGSGITKPGPETQRSEVSESTML